MNWKLILAVTAGVILGVLVAPRLGGAVQAAPLTSGARYQIQGATADETSEDGRAMVAHEVFLVDTEGGRVWEFQGTVKVKQDDGKTTYLPASFEPIGISRVLPPQP